MSDALNQMFSFMQDSQSKMDAFVRYSLEKFMRTDDSIASVSNRVTKVEGAVDENENSIAFLIEDKISKSELEEIKAGLLSELKAELTQLNSISQKELEAKLNSSSQQAENSDLSQATSTLKSEIRSEISQVKNALHSEQEKLNLFRQEQQEKLEQIKREQLALIDLQKAQLNDLGLDMKRIKHRQSMADEKANARDIQAKHLSLTIEGLPEQEGKSVVDSIIDRFNNDAKANLTPSDFSSAYRVGTERFEVGGGRLPQQVRVKMTSDQSRNKYRRRKLMLKELVKHK